MIYLIGLARSADRIVTPVNTADYIHTAKAMSLMGYTDSAGVTPHAFKVSV